MVQQCVACRGVPHALTPRTNGPLDTVLGCAMSSRCAATRERAAPLGTSRQRAPQRASRPRWPRPSRSILPPQPPPPLPLLLVARRPTSFDPLPKAIYLVSL